MKTKREYFLLGTGRLLFWGAVCAIVIFAFNVIGYWLVRYDFNFIGMPTRHTELYVWRALLLAFVGFVNVVAIVSLVAIKCALVAAIFYGILHLGGYRITRKKNDH